MTDETLPDSDSDVPAMPRHRRRLHWHIGYWMLVWLTLGGVFVFLASMSLTGRVVALPAWVAEKVQARLNDSLPTGSADLQRVEFAMSPQGFPRLQIIDLTLRDPSGLEILQLHQLRGGVQLLPLLEGEVVPSQLTLSGAQVTLRRNANGQFDLSLGQSSVSGDFAAILDTIDGLFATGPLAQAQLIRADDLTISLEDARSGRLWRVTDGRLTLTQTEKVVDITVRFDVFNQTETLAETVLGFRAAKDSSEASFGATFRNAAAADIAAQSPVLAFLGVIDAPISGALRTSINAQGEISDLAGTLELGAGALSPSPGARPVRFDRAKVYIDYEPGAQRLDFTEFNLASELGEARGSGRIYLRDYNRGWPTTLLGQVQVDDAQVNPMGVFDGPLPISRGAADFRLRLTPFTLDIGQLAATHAGRDFRASGRIEALAEGWSVALDAETDTVRKDEVLALWPVSVAGPSRRWVEQNLLAGEIVQPRASLRVTPGTAPALTMQAGFRNTRARVIKAMAPVEDASGYVAIQDGSFTGVAETGIVPAPNGGRADVSGTVFHVPVMTLRPTPAEIQLAVAGTIPDLMSLMAAPPFNVLRNSDLAPDFAEGEVVARGQVRLSMKPSLRPEDVDFDIAADLTGVRSVVLVPGKTLSARRATLTATPDELRVAGSVRIGKARGQGVWIGPLGPEAAGNSRVEADLVLNQDFLDEFNIGLPAGTLGGEGSAQVEMTLARDTPARFRLVSDLNRLRISIPDLSWSKPAGRKGHLLAEGTLGEIPRIDRLEIEAPGLNATGSVTVRPGGGLDRAEFTRVRFGGWLDAPVTFIGQGANRPVAISVNGGSADMRHATFSGTPGTSRSGGGPVTLALNRLTISEGIVLTPFNADLSTAGGLNGTFTAQVNGGPAIKGVVAPQTNGSAVRITSTGRAGGVLRAAGVFKTARGGDLTLTLVPLAGEGVYEGEVKIADIRVVGASALAELLSAVSVVGLLEQLGEEGIAFSDVEARFRLTPTQVVVTKGSATGASLGVSLDGTYQLGSGKMDMAGVISPFYLVNGVGQVFTRKGEGLIGFTYTMKGTPDDPKVSVNPLSILTPGLFREIFRKPPPKLDDTAE